MEEEDLKKANSYNKANSYKKANRYNKANSYNKANRLAPIKEYHDDGVDNNHSLPDYIYELSYKLHLFNDQKQGHTSEEIETIFWYSLEKIMNESDVTKQYILNNWEFGDAFRKTEAKHLNNNIEYGTTKTWTQSF